MATRSASAAVSTAQPSVPTVAEVWSRLSWWRKCWVNLGKIPIVNQLVEFSIPVGPDRWIFRCGHGKLTIDCRHTKGELRCYCEW